MNAEIKRLVDVIALFRTLIDENDGVPRYTVTPGAALNSVVESGIDPVLREYGLSHSPAVAETDRTALDNAGLLGGASSAPDHTTMEARGR